MTELGKETAVGRELSVNSNDPLRVNNHLSLDVIDSSVKND